jgi:hypothetical protein
MGACTWAREEAYQVCFGQGGESFVFVYVLLLSLKLSHNVIFQRHLQETSKQSKTSSSSTLIFSLPPSSWPSKSPPRPSAEETKQRPKPLVSPLQTLASANSEWPTLLITISSLIPKCVVRDPMGIEAAL